MQKHVRVHALRQTKATDDYITVIVLGPRPGNPSHEYFDISPDVARDFALELLDAAAAFAGKTGDIKSGDS